MAESEESSIDSEHDQILPLLHTMQEMMKAMLDETDASLDTLHTLYKEVHQSQDLYIRLHLDKDLEPLLKRWTEEARISEDGLMITLTQEEKEEFCTDAMQLTIYDVCFFFIQKKTS